MLLAIVGIFYLNSQKTTAIAGTDTIVVADFTNTTGDPVFDVSLRQGLAAQLAQSPFLSLVSDSTIAQTLSLMGKPRDTRLNHQLARDVCQRTGARATIEGGISGLNAPYQLQIRAVIAAAARRWHKSDVLRPVGTRCWQRWAMPRVECARSWANRSPRWRSTALLRRT